MAVFAASLGGLAVIDCIGRQDAFALHPGLIFQRLVLGAEISQVAAEMPVQSSGQALRTAIVIAPGEATGAQD